MAILRSARVLYKDKLAFWLLNFGVLFVLGTWLIFLFKKALPSPLAVLHVNIYSGIDVIGNSNWLFGIPAIFFGLSIIDVLLAIYLWTKNRLFSYLLLIAMLLMNLILFLYLFNILDYNK
ncbi:MAG: hypothetical protein Q8O32_02580 [bacterium]|nr:hypothetical protein [bacterium]